jgi:hypothetical protein
MRSAARLITILGPVVSLSFAANAVSTRGFIGSLNNTTTVASTVPENGDVNPYGIAVVPVSTGALEQGSILVSNFNDSGNFQGTGTTIVEISPNGNLRTFAELNAGSLPGACPGGVGLTTALVVLRSGWVIVGSLPTSDGTAATAKAGCLIVLDHDGRPVTTLSGDGINGPWDMTALDFGASAMLFVTNVLNGTVAAGGDVVDGGTVLRIFLVTPSFGAPFEVSRTVIASGFEERTDPAALVIGPTGVALSFDGSLYVADTLKNRITAIPLALIRTNSAGTGQTISQGGALNGPLGLALAFNGDLLAVNSNDGNMVELAPGGQQVAVKAVDVSGQGAGTLFGLAIAPNNAGVYYVDDGNNTLNLLH